MSHLKNLLSHRDSKGTFKGEFSGKIHDFKRPMKERAKARASVGPYEIRPTQPMEARGFYMQHDTSELKCARHGCAFRLRIIHANEAFEDNYSRTRKPSGYGFNEFGDTIEPFVARLPHGRGFLAGWTMGVGMCATLELDIYESADDAAYAAHSIAEYAAEEQERYEARERKELDEDEEESEDEDA